MKQLIAVAGASACLACLVGQTGQASVSPIDVSFLGTWTLNKARTKFGTASETFEQVGDAIRITIGSRSYAVKLDGKDYPEDIPGVTDAWRRIDRDTFEHISKINGEVVGISTWKASPDSTVFTVTRRQIRPERTLSTTTYRRVSAGAADNPLIGVW